MPNRFAQAGATVAAATVLTICTGATAYADTSPLPPVPSPSDLLSTLQQTLTPTSPSPSPITTPTVTPIAAPGTTPIAAPGTTSQQTTDQPLVTAAAAPKAAPRLAAAPHHARTATTPRTRPAAHPAAPAPMTGSYVVPATLRLPPATEVGASSAQQPTIAPLLVNPPARHAVSAAESSALASGHADLRALLVALALGAAAAVGAGHLGQLRRGTV